MTRRPISLAHLTVLDATPPALVSVAAAAGFRTIGIRLTGPPRVGTPPYALLSAEAEDARTLVRFCELCDRAAVYGLHVCLEFAIYTGVRTLAHAAEVVVRSKRPNASVLIDALHFSRSGGLPAHVAQVDPSL